MKTLALTLAATLIASSSAFAIGPGGTLFDVNDAPTHFGTKSVQALDIEPTASIGTAPRAVESNNGGFVQLQDRNPGLFDVDD
ncbi:MAG: hypothetical protein AAF412_07525 [Pseudomonadota bacterium]